MFPNVNVNLFALIKIPFYHKLDFDLSQNITKLLYRIDYFDQFPIFTTIVHITLI